MSINKNVVQIYCPLSNAEFTLYSFSSPIIVSLVTGSQCRVTWVLSMSDTLRFRGAVVGPWGKQRWQWISSLLSVSIKHVMTKTVFLRNYSWFPAFVSPGILGCKLTSLFEILPMLILNTHHYCKLNISWQPVWQKTKCKKLIRGTVWL